MTKMDYKKLVDDLPSYCHLNCSACEYAGDALECTIKKLASTAITELLARAEAAKQRCKEMEARCKRLDEARERANEAAAKWEGMYRMALERAEKAENWLNELKARYLSKEPCLTCSQYEKHECDGDCLRCTADCKCNKCEEYSMWEWNGQKEE